MQRIARVCMRPGQQALGLIRQGPARWPTGKIPGLPVRACLLSPAGRGVPLYLVRAKEEQRHCSNAPQAAWTGRQVPAVVLGKDAALADARDKPGCAPGSGAFRLLGGWACALEHEAGAARLGGGIVGGCGDGAFPRGPAQTDIAVSKGRGKAFFHNGCRELFHAGGATGFKGIHGADMVVRRLIMTGKTAGTAGCQQDEAQKGGESMAAGHGISSLGYRDAAGKEGRESVRSSHACRDTGRWREDLVVGSGTFPSGRWDGEYETYFVAMFYFRNRNF